MGQNTMSCLSLIHPWMIFSFQVDPFYGQIQALVSVQGCKLCSNYMLCLICNPGAGIYLSNKPYNRLCSRKRGVQAGGSGSGQFTLGIKLGQPSRVAEKDQAAVEGLLAPPQAGQQLWCHFIRIWLCKRVILVEHAALKARSPQCLPIKPGYGGHAHMRQCPLVLPLWNMGRLDESVDDHVQHLPSKVMCKAVQYMHGDR